MLEVSDEGEKWGENASLCLLKFLFSLIMDLY